MGLTALTIATIEFGACLVVRYCFYLMLNVIILFFAVALCFVLICVKGDDIKSSLLERPCFLCGLYLYS